MHCVGKCAKVLHGYSEYSVDERVGFRHERCAGIAGGRAAADHCDSRKSGRGRKLVANHSMPAVFVGSGSVLRVDVFVWKDAAL